jgi:hypothetical protein
MKLLVKAGIISVLIFFACTINKAKYPLCTDPSIPIIGNMVLKIDSTDHIKQVFDLSGWILESKTKEPLPGVNIYIIGTSLGVVTDIHGFFKFSFNDVLVSDSLTIALIGYNDLKYCIEEIVSFCEK